MREPRHEPSALQAAVEATVRAAFADAREPIVMREADWISVPFYNSGAAEYTIQLRSPSVSVWIHEQAVTWEAPRCRWGAEREYHQDDQAFVEYVRDQLAETLRDYL